MSRYEVHPIVLAVIPKGEPVYSERVTRIEIQDEAAGPFVEIRQPGKLDTGAVSINDLEEWESLDQAVRGMLELCKQLDKKESP
jgi:hypothetical protein